MGLPEPPQSDLDAHSDASQPPQVPSTPRTLPIRILLIACMILLGWAAGGPLVLRWDASRKYSFQLDAEEGFILNQALTLAAGESIYAPIDEPPFLVGNYTPLFPWVYGLFNGPRADVKSLPLGRLLVQLATLAAALALGLTAGLHGRRWLPALLAPALFLATYEVHNWSAFVRVDLPALALSVTGLGVFLLWRRRAGLVIAAVIFVAAAFTRQTAVLAPLACAVMLLLRDRRRLLWFAGPWVVGGLVVLGWLQIATGGEFWRHVVTYNRNPMDWLNWRRVMLNEVWFFHRWWILAIGAGVLLTLASCIRRPKWTNTPDDRETTRGVIGLYALFSLAWLPAMAKVGSAPNYLLEPLAACALYTASLFGSTQPRPKDVADLSTAGRMPSRIRFWGLHLVACLLLLHGLHLISRRREMTSSPFPGRDRYEIGAVRYSARMAKGDVYCEEPIFTLLAGKTVIFQPFILTQLAREGRWDDDLFNRMIRKRRFDRMIFTEDLGRHGPGDRYLRYTDATAAAVGEYYDVQKTYWLPSSGKSYHVWIPRADE